MKISGLGVLAGQVLIFARCGHAVDMTPRELRAKAACEASSTPTSPAFYAPKVGGGYQCVTCSGPVYTDPKTDQQACCLTGEQWSVDSVVTTEGACCSAGKKFSFDDDVKDGDCCPVGQKFITDSCQIPPPDDTDDDVPCNTNFVCPGPGHLGIKFGRCYVMDDINGLHLSREAGAEGTYQSGGDIGGLIFRICATTDNCDARKGQLVPADGTWSIQDQQGPRGGTGPGWFANVQPHMGVRPWANPELAAVFKAEPFCIYKECALCLRLGTIPEQGISAPCPMGASAAMSHLAAAPNPSNCKMYRFQEITCMRNVPSKPPGK